jgi:hypothetical protein
MYDDDYGPGIGTVLGLLSGLFCIVLIGLGIAVWWRGWHYQTGAGDHTGYITAAETTGIFFKTNTVYLKTNTTSTQEDAYCVIDSAVFAQLQQDSVNSTHVNVHYISWFAAGVHNCNGEGAIITSVTPLSD